MYFVEIGVALAQHFSCCCFSVATRLPDSGSARPGRLCRLEGYTPSAVQRTIAEDDLMKYILVLSLAVHAALAQTATVGAAKVAGTVLDGKTLKPVPAALVIATRAGAPPFSRNTKAGGDGAFQIQGLTLGNYSL